MKSKLKPLDFTEDVKRYDAREEKKRVHTPKCRHKELTYAAEKAEVRCKCGAAWSGVRLSELENLFTG